MRPLLGWKRWTPVAVEPYVDTSFGANVTRTLVLYQRNGKTKTRMDGHWSLAQLASIGERRHRG